MVWSRFRSYGLRSEAHMGEQTTRGVMDRYFKRMGAGEDFSDCYTADVTWTTFDDGRQVHGAGPHGRTWQPCTRTWLTRDPGASSSPTMSPTLKVTAPTRAPAMSTELPIALLT